MRLRRHTLRGDAKLSSRGGYARAWYVPVRRFSDQTLRLLDLGLPSKRDDTGKDNKLVGAIAGVSDPSDNQTDLRTAFEDVSLAFAELGKVHAGLKVEHLHQQAVIQATPDAIHVYDVATCSLVRGNRSGKPLIGFTASMVAVLSGVDVDALVPAEDRRQLAQLFVDACSLPDAGVAKFGRRVQYTAARSGGCRGGSRRSPATPMGRSPSCW